jgi:hypothetical protein
VPGFFSNRRYPFILQGFPDSAAVPQWSHFALHRRSNGESAESARTASCDTRKHGTRPGFLRFCKVGVRQRYILHVPLRPLQ